MNGERVDEYRADKFRAIWHRLRNSGMPSLVWETPDFRIVATAHRDSSEAIGIQVEIDNGVDALGHGRWEGSFEFEALLVNRQIQVNDATNYQVIFRGKRPALTSDLLPQIAWELAAMCMTESNEKSS